MSRRYPTWEIEGADWPNRAASSFVEAGGYTWHVQELRPAGTDEARCIVLIHGTGAATHSWRELMPLLAREQRVIAMDLPGHGFTRPSHAHQVTLPAMARSIGELLDTLEVEPAMIVGHSAGAAIALELAFARGWNVPVVGLNPALLPFPGLAAKLFPQLASLLFTNPVASRIFARMARFPGEVERFLPRATGSRIDRIGIRHYRAMLSRAGHCDGAIRMMANWRLEPLEAQLPKVSMPVLLVHGTADKAIPLAAVRRAAAAIPDCQLRELAGLGHLAHEERPEEIGGIIAEFAARMTDRERHTGG